MVSTWIRKRRIFDCKPVQPTISIHSIRPPGTGKTITLVESICHIVKQSKENRVLVCTPSKMAADNFAEALVDREAIDPKYIFRMHSLSTSPCRSFVILKHTYRSHLKILRPCSYLFYDNMLVANEEDEFLYKLCEWQGLPRRAFQSFFILQMKAMRNLVVCSYVHRILAETDIEEKDIGVISPYKNQVLKLRTVLSKYPRITIDSVEGFRAASESSRNDELLKQHLSWKKFIFYCNFHGGYLDNKGKNCTDLADVYYDEKQE
uniref:RNA helicase n=1 Tax=Ditylenchus dipsaci TaxID=166011 RepID=A0A915E1T8_9BILA